MNKVERELELKRQWAEAELKRRAKEQKKGILILTIGLGVFYTYTSHNNHPEDNIFMIIGISLVAAFITTMILFAFTKIMKNWFKW